MVNDLLKLLRLICRWRTTHALFCLWFTCVKFPVFPTYVLPSPPLYLIFPEIKAKRTTERLESQGFKIDTKEEEASKLRDAMASFSYDSNMKNSGKSSVAAEKSAGKTATKKVGNTTQQPSLSSKSDVSVDSSKSGDSSSSASSIDTRPDIPKTITVK